MLHTYVTAQGLAFEVPLHDPADEDSLIRKHPPRRLQRLEEQPVSPPTLQELQDKLAEAQQRRLQVILSRLPDTCYYVGHTLTQTQGFSKTDRFFEMLIWSENLLADILRSPSI